MRPCETTIVAHIAFSFPEAAILLVSTADRDLWPVPNFESTIRGLPVVLRSLRIFPKWRTSQRTSLIDLYHEGHEGLNFGLESLGLGDISLKKKYKVLKLLVVEKKYVLAVLPTGYGSTSQLLPKEDHPRKIPLGLLFHRLMPLYVIKMSR